MESTSRHVPTGTPLTNGGEDADDWRFPAVRLARSPLEQRADVICGMQDRLRGVRPA